MKIILISLASLIAMGIAVRGAVDWSTVEPNERIAVTVPDGTGKKTEAMVLYDGEPVYRGIVQALVDSGSANAGRICMISESYSPVAFVITQGREDPQIYMVHVDFEHKNVFGMKRTGSRIWFISNQSRRVNLFKWNEE